MYGQAPWGRSVDVDADGPNRVGAPARPTSRVGPMGPTPRRQPQPPATVHATGPASNHSGGPVSPGRYLANRKEYEDDEEEDSVACSSVSD